MYQIKLINMPFASLQRPSIALTQLAAMVDRELPGQVASEVHYLNLDFAGYLGSDSYHGIAESLEAGAAGAGDWFFRQVAFPQLPDNSYPYFQRYFSGRDDGFEALKFKLLEKRRGLEKLFGRWIDRYRLAEADLVGFTLMFSQNVASFGMARMLKERNPDLLIVAGGANCESPMGQEIARNVDAVDYVFSGPALKSFPQLVGHLIAGEARKSRSLAGVFSKASLEGPFPSAGSLGEELPIDVEVPLSYDGFLSELEEKIPGGEIKPYILFETSRGCWWGERAHCTFCGLNGGSMKYRAMEPERALDQFARLFSAYGDTAGHFESVDNIMPRSYLDEVFPRLDPPPEASIFYEVKADLKDEEMQVLAAARVNYLQPGIESLATSTLKLMRKGTTSFINLRFLRSCITYGIRPLWNLLVGFPNEEESVYRKYLADMPRLYHLPPPSGVFPVRFDRYSPYFTQAEDYDLDLKPCEYFFYIYPFAEEVLEKMVYYFVDRNRTAPYAVTTARWLDPLRSGVAEWQRQWASGGGRRPELGWSDGATVLDSRSGERVEHRLDGAALEILRGLVKPGKRERLSARFDHLGDSELERALDELEERQLVFVEDGTTMSLVGPLPAAGEQRAA